MTTEQTEKRQTKRKRKRLLVVLVFVVLLGGAYVAFLLAASPRDLKEQIASRIRACFAGKVLIGKARFYPTEGIVVRELHLAGPNGEPFLYIRKLVLRHDFSALLKRRLEIKEVEIEDPAVWLHSSAEEGWNIQQLLKGGGEVDLSCAPISMLSIRGGSVTISDESRVRRFPSVALSNVTIEAKPREGDDSSLGIEGAFTDNVIGQWELTGKLDVPKSAFEVSISREELPLDERLRKRIPSSDLGPFRELEALDGMASMAASVSYAAAPDPRFHYRLRLDLAKCRARLAGFPYTLDTIQGAIEFEDGRIVLKKVKATSDAISASADGYVCPDRESDMTVEVAGLPLDDRLFGMVGKSWQNAMARMKLRGLVDVTCRTTRSASDPLLANQVLTVDLKDCSAVGADMPISIEKLNGTMIWNGRELSLKKVSGQTPVGPITVRDTTVNMDLDVRRSMDIEMKNVSIADLLSQLGQKMPDLQEQVAPYHPSGVADILCRVSWEHDGEELQQEIFSDFRDMSMAYPGVNRTLHDLTGKLHRLPDRLTIESAAGEFGKNPILLRNLCLDLKSKQVVFGQITMEGWPIDEDLKRFVPDNLRKILDDLDLKGRVDVVHKIDPDPTKTETSVTLLDCAAKYKNVPYPISEITGRILHKNSIIVFENVKGKNGAAAIALTTETLDLNRRGPLKIQLAAKNLPMDAQLKSVLPTSMIEYWDLFNPSGSINLDLAISFSPENSENVDVIASVDWNNSSLQYVHFAYPVSDVTGVMEIRPDRIVLKNMEGRAGTGHLRFHDTVIFRNEEYGLDITIEGRDMSLDNTLRECLRKDVLTAWDIVNPGGKFNFTWRQTKGHGKDAKTDYSLEMQLANAEIKCSYFQYPLREMTGAIRFQGNKARFDNVEGRNGKATVTISGYATAVPDVGEDLVFLKIAAKDLPIDHDLRDALPAPYQEVWKELEPKVKPEDRGTISVAGTIRYRDNPEGGVSIEYDLDPLTFHDCRMELGDTPLDNIKGTLSVRGEVCPGKSVEWKETELQAPDPSSAVSGSLNLTEVTVQGKKYTELKIPRFLAKFYGEDFEFHADWIQAYLYGGRLNGEIGIERAEKRNGDKDVRYAAEFKAEKVNVKDLADLTGVDIQGIKGTLEARSSIKGRGLKRDALEVAGGLTIKNGDMGDLPKKFGIPTRFMHSTAFKDLKMEYRIKGAKVLIDTLDFQGDRISLVGRGRLPLDPKQPAELIFKCQGTGPLDRVISGFIGTEYRVKLGGPQEEPILRVDPLVPLRNLVRGMARVLQIREKEEE